MAMTNTFRLSPIEKENNIIRLRGLLSRADDLTLNFQDIENNINDYDIWVYTVDGEIKYALTAQVVGKVYFIGRTAGEGKLFPWEDIVRELKQYASIQDCEELMFYGDKYWEGKVSHLGFKIKQYVYSVKVS